MRKITALVALTTTACSSWHTEAAPAPAVLSEKHPSFIRVELTSGKRIDIYDAKLQGDSIVGLTARRGKAAAYPIAVATKEVKHVATRKFSAGRTAMAVVAITLAASAIAGASSASSASSSTNSSCASAPRG